MKRAILSCTGLDKPEGSLAREVALLAAEATGSEIICPVLLNRSPARYRKEMSESALIVIDGCATRCASKLVAQTDVKIERKLMLYDEVKASNTPIEASLRLGPNAIALARAIADRLIKEAGAPAAETEPIANWENPTEFLTVTHDKFEFRIPAADYLFNENDCWVRIVSGTARIGISDYMQQRLTDIGFFTPPEPGTNVEQFGELGSVESAKAVFEIIAPVSGTITAVNATVVDNPGLVNSDPYGAGWLVELSLTDLEEDKELLLDGEAYSKTVKRKAAEP
jgi:glycine cleavage system H protein